MFVSLGASAAPSALPNGASAVNGRAEEEEKAGAKMALEDLFKDVWMAEEEEEGAGPDAACPSKHVPDTEVLLTSHFRPCVSIY